MIISVVTPTCDRPAAFALAERFMARQTVAPAEWIVADGGTVPARCSMGQIHLHAPAAPGATNFAGNLLRGLAAARGDAVIFIEDDDWLRADHVSRLATALETRALVGSDDHQHYYNVAQRRWRTFNNYGASLCQTGMRRELFADFERMVRWCVARDSYGIDTWFWRSVPREQWGLVGAPTVVGIKGLPGRAGLGVGHRPDARWTDDPALAQLGEWIGADAAIYADFRLSQVAA